MKKLLLAILIVQLTTRLCCAQKFTCDPELDCEAQGPGSKVPDENDCRSFFYCALDGPTPNSTPCEDGEHYSTSSKNCEESEKCDENTCAHDPNTCIIDCDNVAYIPVAGDCNKYIDCTIPTQTPQSCPPNKPYFDGTYCTADSSKCCSVCYYKCIEKNTYVADPVNCNSFYFCTRNDEGTQISCEAGDYFNVVIKDCVKETVPCTPYCSSTPGSGSGVTTPGTGSGVPTPDSGSGECYENFDCPVNFGKFVVCDECISAYYDCSTGTAVVAQCVTGELFDYTISDCVPQDDCPTFSRDSA